MNSSIVILAVVIAILASRKRKLIPVPLVALWLCSPLF